MKVRAFLNGYLKEYENIYFMEYCGDFDAIGADLENDYCVRYKTDYNHMIPETIMNMNIEYFTIEGNDFIIYLEGR